MRRKPKMGPKQKTLNGLAVAIEKKIRKLKRRGKAVDSEYQSYIYIRNELKDRGWNIANPNREASGQLYTQHEYLQNPEIASKWGKLHSEYVVKLAEDKFWVIEAKPRLEEIDKAFQEAKDYGKLLNEHKFVRAMIVTGVAGNDIDKYLVRSAFWVESNKTYQTIVYEEKEITSILSPEIAKRLIDQNTPVLKEFDIPDDELLKAADEINKNFHLAGIKKAFRATIVASMLLSLLGDTEPNINATPDILIEEINVRAKEALKEHEKEDADRHIEIQLPEKPDAKGRFKEAIVDAFFILRKVNIKAAMRTGSDVLGRFYETFLKYGNGAKDLGIVLTPRNITEFATEVLNITYRDILYDPTCGTGGFLVSGFYRVKNNAIKEQLETFRIYRIFGIDLQPSVEALAIVNMIFRGDGRNNIINDDCFTRGLVTATNEKGEATAVFVSRESAVGQKRPVTRVLMNPPFALKKSSEKEFKFIDHALGQMDDGGLLFSILPCSAMVKSGSYKKWRKNSEK
jgi:type I restriction enzyme M protein